MFSLIDKLLAILSHLQTEDNELRDSCISEIKKLLKQAENEV